MQAFGSSLLAFPFFGQFESTKLNSIRTVLKGKVRNFPTTKISSFTVYQKLLEIEKEIVHEVARGNKHNLRKSANRKARISSMSGTNALLICALRSAIFPVVFDISSNCKLRQNLFFLFPPVFDISSGKKNDGVHFFLNNCFRFFDWLSNHLRRRVAERRGRSVPIQVELSLQISPGQKKACTR